MIELVYLLVSTKQKLLNFFSNVEKPAILENLYTVLQLFWLDNVDNVNKTAHYKI